MQANGDFVVLHYADIKYIRKILKKYRFTMGIDMKEFITLEGIDNTYRSIKTVIGTLIRDKREGKILSTAVMDKLLSKRGKLKRTIKRKCYRALAKSVLTYNCVIWALKQGEKKIECLP